METSYTVKDYIEKLTKKEIKSFDKIPEEYRNVPDIIALARNLGLRKSGKRGYDVISGVFFVEEVIMVTNYVQELVAKNILNTFPDFQAYYVFLDGDIYDEACYFQYDFTDEMVKKFGLDISRLNMQSTLNYTIDDCLPEPSENEKEQYDEIERQVALRKKWIKKYNACLTYKDLLSVSRKHEDSKDNTCELFYLWNYINYHGNKSFKVIMKFICSGQCLVGGLPTAMCFLFGVERVLKSYDYRGGVASTNKRHNTIFKKSIEDIINRGVVAKTVKYFDKSTHYYCIKTELYLKDNPSPCTVANLYKYFETFNQFVDYLENDLSDCDLSNALSLNVDFSKFKTNSGTKFPFNSLTDLKKVVYKRYNRISAQFEVIIKWCDTKGIEVLKKQASFKYFFDFVAFLKNDLSEADLLFCDGLQNLLDFSQFNFTNARLRSLFCKQIGIVCTKGNLLNNQAEGFVVADNNERETAIVLKDDRATLCEYNNDIGDQKIYYITDLHLMHRIHHANCVTDEDCIYVIQSIIDTLVEKIPYRSIILIGGDVASDFSVFKLFVQLLRQTNYYVKVIFTLGNHELWEFQGESLDIIVQKYKNLLLENNMYLLQNEILYINDKDDIINISQQELNNLTDKDIKQKLRTARIVLFGGFGFSGYNQEFNANNGIYRMTLSRGEEIYESKIFENLYDRVCALLPDKNVIVLTHMPFADWHISKARQNNFIYVSGHNHKNTFYDDGIIRIYADNQVGYHNESPRLKYFYMENTYDWFSDYEDGIFQITRDDYINFYHGKNLSLTFNREINKLYMLKKKDYYCFIHQNTSGGLTILNGGGLKSLKSQDIQYYYENMDAEINFIKTPLDKFQSIQQQISRAVKEIGGWGYIHGAIVDIDFYSHVYVNPNDLTIAPYFALDMIAKTIYPSVPALLKSHCPLLYSNYNKALTGDKRNIFAIKESDNELTLQPQLYLSTDIYAASREIKKMQKLNSNILSIWHDNIPGIKVLPSEEKSVLSETEESEK